MASYEERFLQDLKNKKRKRDSIYEAVETLRSIPICDVKSVYQDKIDVLKVILEAKFGNLHIPSIVESLRNIPHTLSASDRKFLVEKILAGLVKEGQHDLEDYASLFLIAYQPSENTTLIEVLTPPVDVCLQCSKILTRHNNPCKVTVFETKQAYSALKLILRCNGCEVNYGYATYGNNSTGYRFYQDQRPLVEATDEIYIERLLCDFHASLA